MSKTRILTQILLLLLITKSVESPSVRIVGGRPAHAADYPYQVSLKRSTNDVHFCGGSIITPRHVLTAAHCCFYIWGGELPPSMVSVFVGQLALKVKPSSVFRNASRIVVHPDHDEFLMSNDIAVVELDKDLPLNNKFIRTIPLNKQTVPANTSCMVSGWGLLQFEGEGMSQELLTTEVYTVDMTECTRRYQLVKIKLGKGAMCAVNDNRVSDACQGDSGGPLVCAGRLVGVISTGKECGNASFPGVYTDVRLFVPWIERVIKESEVTVTPPNSPRSQTVLSLQTPPESASSSKTFQTLVLTLVAIAQSVHILSDFCLVLRC